jgi:hypothetical protein
MRKSSELTSYCDYIKSEYWTERKRLYYLSHPHACAVCGHPDVDLHHCRNMFYQSQQVVEDMRPKWQEMRDAPIHKQTQSNTCTENSFANFIEQVARPIWHFLGRG